MFTMDVKQHNNNNNSILSFMVNFTLNNMTLVVSSLNFGQAPIKKRGLDDPVSFLSFLLSVCDIACPVFELRL